MTNVVIFASGSGTNAENIIRYFKANRDVNVSMLFTNNREARAMVRASRVGVPAFPFTDEDFENGSNVMVNLEAYSIDFIVLAGFLKKISEPILRAYPKRIVNIHPALLPKFGGKGMYGMRVHEAVIAAGEKKSGISIHYVNENYDEGQIIFQAECAVSPDDTPETLATKVHELEYEHYPRVIEKVLMELKS